MATGRRKVLKIAGATVMVAGAALAWRTYDRGVSAHPLNQMPERADRERQLGIEPRFGKALQKLVGDPGVHALMPFRIGYPTVAAQPSPRRDLQSVLVRS